MLDHRPFLNDRDRVFAELKKRRIDAAALDRLAQLIDDRRGLIQRTEGLRREQNEANTEMQQKAKAGDKAALESAREQLKSLKAAMKTLGFKED